MEHGGRIGAAEARWGKPPLPWIDLSTGINPWPYPVPSLPPGAWTRLPEPDTETALLSAASAYLGGVADDRIVAAPGSQCLIHLLPRLLAPTRVGVLTPTYGEHAPAWRAAGHDVADLPLTDAVTDRDLPDRLGLGTLVLCRPNNPDGAVLPMAVVLEWAERLSARGGRMLVDEAFCDADPAVSLAASLPQRGGVVLRSFGKFFGLAGLRLGFAVAAPDTAATIRAALGPWAVSGPALAIGARALSDRNWVAATRRRLTAAAATLDADLGAAGLSLRGGTALFRLAEAEEAHALWDRLGRAGLLVRAFADRPRLLRFGLPPDDAARARLRAALANG